MSSSPIIDHVVLLVPYEFLASPPSWLTDAFKVSPGGTHADGVTANILVHLPDGTYLEFMAFVPDQDPSKRLSHRWGKKTESTVIDWAVTIKATSDGESEGTHGEETFHQIQKKVPGSQPELYYQDLINGGRLRPDGVELKWSVSYTKRQDDDSVIVEPGQTPFWCLDRTPRHLRVPFQEPGATDHPSGVLGVANIQVHRVDQLQKYTLQSVFAALFNGDPNAEESSPPSYVGGLHPGGKISIVEDSASGKIDISFYSRDKSWAGKTIGGKVGDHGSLEFKVVGVE